MADRFTKTVIVVCLTLICCMFSYYMGYDNGLTDHNEITNKVFEAASEPYKTHTYDTSKFNTHRVERYQERTPGTVLQASFKTEGFDIETPKNTTE